MTSFSSLLLSLTATLTLSSLLIGCSDGGGGAAPGSTQAPATCSSDSECGAGFGCQLQALREVAPGLTPSDCDPEDPFCDPTDPPGGPGAGMGGSGTGLPDPGGETGATSSSAAGQKGAQGGSSQGTTPRGKCVALPGQNGQGGNQSSGGSNQGSGNTNQGSGNTNQGSGSTTGGPSCNGDFSLGSVPFTTGDLSGWGKACSDSSVPKNCPDGSYINLAGSGCLCVVKCSSFNNVTLGDSCATDGICQKVTSTNGNGNYATLCVPKSLNLCTDASSGGSGQGGSTGQGGSPAQGGSSSCLPKGAECENDGDCCSDSCFGNACD